MKIEELSKSQIVLLTLLVSFVTSIATGIVAVSLMDQAPPAITQSVDRIIERTVEKIVPGQAAAVITTKTVIVKESDLISESVEKIAPSVVRLYSGTSTEFMFLGLGVVVNDAGTIISDIETVGKTERIYALRRDGVHDAVVIDSENSEYGIVHMHASSTVPWKPAQFSSVQAMLGQTVITVSGESTTRIQDGIVTGLLPTKSNFSVLDTNVNAGSVLPGEVLINTDGEVMGMSTSLSRSLSSSSFIPANILLQYPVPTSAP